MQLYLDFDDSATHSRKLKQRRNEVQFMTTNAVARTLTRSAESVRWLADRGLLPCIRTTTGQRLFTTEVVHEFIRSGRNGSRPTLTDEADD